MKQGIDAKQLGNFSWKSLLKKILIVFLSLIIACVIFSFLLLKLGSYFFTTGNYVQSAKFYKISSSLLPFWELPKKRLSAINQLNQDKRLVEERIKNKIEVGEKDISIIGKRISNVEQSPPQDSGVLVNAILKNNLEIGIPTVKITKINLLKNGKIVAFKKLTKELFLVSKGEIPFSVFFSQREKVPAFDDFQLEVQAPAFIPDNRVVRIKVIETKKETVLAHANNASYYKYKVTLLNDSSCTINNVYQIAFQKDGDNTFDEYQSAPKVFIKEQPESSDVVDLDNKNKETFHRLNLKPGEQKEINIELMIDSMYKGLYDLNSVKLESYFIGVKEKGCF